MNPIQVSLLGIDVVHPASVLTNLLLMVECLWLAHRIRPGGRSRVWKGFFVALAVGAGFGAIKHGFPSIPVEARAAVRFASNLGLIVAVTFAQLAVLAARPEWGRWRPVLAAAAFVQLAVFFGWSLRTQDFLVPALDLALGMGPVLVVETIAALRGRDASRWIAGGLGVALAGGAVYALEVAPSPWFSHVDVAHVLLGLTVALVFQGVWIDDLGLPRGRRSWS
jgi:hypothetical protein